MAMINKTEQTPTEEKFLQNEIVKDVFTEIARAQGLHPDWPDDMVYGAAIVAEESGEVVRAAVQYEMEEGNIDDVESELIQTAATCIRMLTKIRTGNEVDDHYFVFKDDKDYRKITVLFNDKHTIQAAEEHGAISKYSHVASSSFYDGAKWQQDQFREIIKAIVTQTYVAGYDAAKSELSK